MSLEKYKIIVIEIKASKMQKRYCGMHSRGQRGGKMKKVSKIHEK